MLWRLVQSPPMRGADNMALDVALMSRARRTGETTLRLYSWSTPTLSLGRNQRAAGAYDARALAEAGLDVVRRPTGGRGLLHGRELTYSVTAPAVESLGRTYARINVLLVNALVALGVPAELAEPTGRSAVPDATPCFAEPSAGEVVAHGRKLAGSAQWRDDGALLQHGSILVDDEQGRAAPADAPGSSGVPAAATLRALLGRAPALEELGVHLLRAIRATECPAAGWCTLESDVLSEAAARAGHYRDPAWTWRR